MSERIQNPNPPAGQPVWAAAFDRSGGDLFNEQYGNAAGNPWDIFVRLWPLLFIFGGLDSLYKREGVVGPALAIGLGGVFLLANLNFLALDVWWVILRIWPVFIVAAGFDLLIGRRSIWASLAGLVAVLVILGGTLWLSGVRAERGAAITGQAIHRELSGATQARVSLSPGAGSLRLGMLGVDGVLIDGRAAAGSGQNIYEDFSMDGNTAVYTLRQSGSAFYSTDFASNDWRWDLSLTPGLPIDLTVNLGAGNADLDLNGLNLSAMKIDLGVGQTIVTLPAEGSLNGDINGGVGQLVVRVPDGVAVRIVADTGLTAKNFPASYHRDGDTYTSPGYDSAANRIDLKMDMGIGNIRVEQLGK